MKNYEPSNGDKCPACENNEFKKVNKITTTERGELIIFECEDKVCSFAGWYYK